MIKTELLQLWDRDFSGVPMLNRQFRHQFPDRWLRIHSLKASQRYPASEADWQALLSRQNNAISAVFGAGSEVILIRAAHYYIDEPVPVPAGQGFAGITDLMPFEPLEAFDKHTIDAGYEPGAMLRPEFSISVWRNGYFEPLLRLLAVEEESVFFISPDAHAIAAPYDGGIDFIFRDEETREWYRDLLREWLSPSPSGL